MFLFKSLPQGLFHSEDANSNKLISRCYHALGLGLLDTVKFPPGRRKTKQSKNTGDREQASNSESTKVKWRFSKLLSNGSQICLKTSEITSTNHDRICGWTQIWRICSYYEFAHECKFIRYCINQNTTLHHLFKARPTNSNSQSEFRFPRGIKSAREKRDR